MTTERNEQINSNPNELELPTPQRKNEQPTTEQPVKEDNNTGNNQNGNYQKDEKNNSGIDYNDEKDLGKQTGFQLPGNEENSGKHHPAEKEKIEERENSDNPTYKNAKWQQNKMNEANNQKGVPVDSKGMGNKETEKIGKEALVSDENKEKGEPGDANKDSIIDSPKTETYGENPNKSTGDVIKKSNYSHTREEEKREKNTNKHKVL